MKTAAELRSGKNHLDENFPVASRLIHPRHRPAIMAFYEFVRTADDVADHPSLSAPDKLLLLDRLEEGLLGKGKPTDEAGRLRQALIDRDLSPRHAQDLLHAFRMDVEKLRYRDWDDLMGYCSYSAMPVGRFVLDVHGESRNTWPLSDQLCAALQIINHVQDCGMDYRRLNRIYIPMDALDRAGATIETLGAAKASPALRRCFDDVSRGVWGLLRSAEPLAKLVDDFRLGLEISVIHTLARALTDRLSRRDPLSERSQLTTAGVAGLSIVGIAQGLTRRATGRRSWQGPAIER
jgi:hydroxysqualene synthase